VDGGVGEGVAAIALRRLRAAVAVEGGVEVAAGARLVGRLRQAAALERQRLVEALVGRPQGVVVAEVPLAEVAAAVAGRPQQFGERRLVGVQQRAAEEGIDDAGAVVVAPRQQGGPSRRADRADVELRQLRPLRRQLVDVGGFDLVVAVDAEVAVALVVGDDEEDVWTFGGGEGKGGEEKNGGGGSGRGRPPSPATTTSP